MRQKNCSCGQNLPKPESTTKQSFNLPPEVTISSDEQNLSEPESTEEKSFNLPTEVYSNDLENWNVKQGVSERSVQNVREYANVPKFCGANSSKQKSITVSSVNETLPCNSTDCNSGDVAPTDDKSDHDSDSDSTDVSSGNSGVEQEASKDSSSWISNIAKKAKGWYSPKKLEEFYPLTEEDAVWLRRKSGRNYELSYVNKLLIKHSVDSPKNLFPCKPAVLNYMKKSLIHEMRPPSVVNNPSFNFKLDNTTKAR